ncbi:unnamed protein product [Moneuplotes crassus]|uniref:Meckelin n=1 Tax=Euplotes crassus TaxID=5936 RepID=A0AAD1XW56_EUPCR|nr:unnamed protein product [Moneuplotes crassus]
MKSFHKTHFSNRILLLSIILALASRLSSAQTIVASTTCTDPQYYNSVSLQCESCPTNFLKSPDGLSCYCPQTFRKVPITTTQTTATYPYTCEACPSGQVANLIQDACLACPGGDCTCGNGSYMQETSATGDLRCRICPKGYYSPATTVTTTSYYCDKCPLDDQTYNTGTSACECPAGTSSQSTFCAPNDYGTITADYNPSTSTGVIYDPVETGSGTNSVTLPSSNTFEYLLPEALYRCLKYFDRKQCNILANLCVYSMYRENYGACLAHRNMLEYTNLTTRDDFYDSDWKSQTPWLYYSETAPQIIEKANRVQGKARFQTSSETRLGLLRFVLGTYNLEGDFLGFQDLGTQLQLCPADYQDSIDYRRFGTSVTAHCSFNVSKLIDSSIQPNNTDVFYDLWLKDTDGDYIDVPVKINNYIDSNNGRPNQKSDRSSWKLTRRFFLYDTKSGLTGTDAYKNGVLYGTYIRWVDKVKMIIELNTDGNDQIFVPYVELEYRAKALTFIPDSRTTDVSYEVEYTMNPSDFWIVAWIFFGIIHIFIFISTIWKTYLWYNRHPKSLMGSVYTYKFLLNVVQFFLESWSTIQFCFLFALSASFYAFFKMDEAAFLVMPHDTGNNLLPFAIIFGMVFVIKIIVIIAKIVRQSACSFYVLDREKNMASLSHTLANALQKKTSEDRDIYEREFKEYEEPKAWRPIFVMNELNELLSSTVIPVELVLIWVGFIMVGEGWQYGALYDPNVNRSDSRNPTSYILMFFLFTVTIFLTAVVIVAVRYAVSFLFPLHYMDFVDLCSVANVSLFIFDEKFHGYYIHGESPANSSDVTLDTLKKALDSEGQGLAKQRGLIQNNPNCQTFEFYLPYGERKLFDEVFDESKEKLSQRKRSSNQYKNTPKVDFIYKSGDIGMSEQDFREIVSKKDEMDFYLVRQIIDARNNPKEYINEVTFLYNFFKLPPEAISTLNHFKLIPDKLMNFTRVLFLQFDWDILWLMVCSFTFLDALGLDVTHSIIIFYVIYKFGLKWLRAELGENNLSKTSGIDSRFLI